MKKILLFINVFPIFATAQLQVAKIFTDNMVLQREQPVHFWGKAIPGKTVTVTFMDEKINTVTKSDSTWIVVFKKQQVNRQPQSVLISSGGREINLKNILLGDLWLCIGQSNMEFPMIKELHYKEEVQNSHQPFLRLYNPTYAGKNTYNIPFTDSIIQNLTAENFYKGQWQSCDSNSFKTMSAVAYYFGKEIVSTENITVGLINISIGGAPLETFICPETLIRSYQFPDKIKGDWLANNALPVWIRERGKQNVGSLSNVPKDEYGNNHSFKPGFAYKSGIAPILNLPIKGILCYQGESNAQEMERVKEYAALSKLMVDDYRKKWKQPELPFYFVQLSSIDTVKYKAQLWPQFRNEQRTMLTLISHSGMAVCSDNGFRDDVHPANKKVVGERLARWALNKTYHKNMIPSGPLPLAAKFKKGKVIINFQYSGKELQTSDGKAVRGFTIDGINEIAAVIQYQKVLIEVKEKPAFIYYGWKSYTDANLENPEKLPASTFKLNVQ
jgi:sialate O-acetylesterase